MLLSDIARDIGDRETIYRNEKPISTMGMLIQGHKSENRCVFISNRAYLSKLDDSVSMVITNKDIADEVLLHGKGVCITEDPRRKFYQIHNYLSTKKWYCREKNNTIIRGNNTNISPLSHIADFNVTIGDNVIIENFVDIKENVTIEDDVIVRSGAVIGNPGYDYKQFGDEIIMTAQTGGVILRKGTEVGSNSCIERAAFPYENTDIGDQTKIGCLCYISHGVKVGKRVFMPNCVSISGYTIIDDDVTIGPNATITSVSHIGANARITLGAVVGSDVKNGKHVSGNFAIPHNKFLQNYMDSLRK